MLGSLGTTTSNGFQQMAQQLVTQHPELAPLVQGFSGLIPQIGQMGNALGQGLIDALHTDNRNMTAGAILLTPTPLYRWKNQSLRTYYAVSEATCSRPP